MTTTFDALAKNPKLTTAEALRQGMIAVIEDPSHPDWSNPSAWAPFILVGEGGRNQYR
jgi:CHAT domain-containing protein